MGVGRLDGGEVGGSRSGPTKRGGNCSYYIYALL